MVELKDEAADGWYFGYVRVKHTEPPSQEQEFGAVSVTSIGLKAGDEFILGYADRERLLIPLDCRLVLIIPSDTGYATIENIKLLIQSYGDVCITNTSS